MSSVLKNRFTNLLVRHKNSLEKEINKRPIKLQIQDAFTYLSYSQLYLGTNNFHEIFSRVKEIYHNDQKFQDYIKQDCEFFNREVDENQVNFFLEEIVMFYLMLKNKVRLPNDFIQDQQKWVLFCYPGKPLKSTVYLFQMNPFDYDWPENKYQNSVYDLSSKKLYDFSRLNLDSWNYE